MDDYSEGDQIEVEFDLRGREWNDKYFTNLQAWRISKAGEGNASGGGAAAAPAGKEPAPVATGGGNANFDDDISSIKCTQPF